MNLRELDLQAITASLVRDGQPTLRPIGIRHAVLGRDALDALPELIAAIRGPGPIVLLADSVVKRRGDVDLVDAIQARIRSLGEHRWIVLGQGGAAVHADLEAVDVVAQSARGAGCLVAVGSGTICDIGKEASRHAGVPLAVVQTANSVNAFADDLAVLLIDGVKQTVPSRWPDVLIADLQVIASAPAQLNQAGVGELMASFTAPGDWRLAAAFGMDDSYDRRVVDLCAEGTPSMAGPTTGPMPSSDDALAQQVERMTLTGIAMGLVGRSAPLSGTEHTVSHMLDMSAAAGEQPARLHGAQVGVGSLAVAVVWDRLLADLRPSDLVTQRADESVIRARMVKAFDRLDRSGGIAAECWQLYRPKLERWAVIAASPRKLAEAWEGVRDEARDLVRPPAAIARALVAAGAPATFGSLSPAVGRDEAAWALFNGHLIRARFSIADLAWFGGLWTESFVDEVLAEAEAVTGNALWSTTDDAPLGGLRS